MSVCQSWWTDELSYCRRRESPSSREESSATEKLSDGRPCHSVTATSRGHRLLFGPLLSWRCIVCRWTASTCLGPRRLLLTPSDEPPLRLRSNGRSSLLVSSRERTEILEQVPASRFTYIYFFPFHSFFSFFWEVLLPLNYCILRTFLVCCVLTRDIFLARIGLIALFA